MNLTVKAGVGLVVMKKASTVGLVDGSTVGLVDGSTVGPVATPNSSVGPVNGPM